MALRLDWRRAALYGVATPIIGWLLWARFCYEPAPEFGQLLSQINANLRLANSIPARGKDGNPVAAHEQLLAAAERDIALASREQKDSAVLAEFDGFARSLRGDFAGAAERYRVARTLPDCAEDQRTVLSFNEARMLRSSGNLAQALQVLTESQQSFSAAAVARDGPADGMGASRRRVRVDRRRRIGGCRMGTCRRFGPDRELASLSTQVACR